MIERYAMIRNGIVENICVWDGVIYSPETGVGWTPPEGYEIICVEDIFCDIGWTWDGQNFINPNPPADPEPAVEEEEQQGEP
jgi:hypothetical protein